MKKSGLYFILTFALMLMCTILESCSEHNDRLLRIQENGQYGYIDTLGNVKITPQYSYSTPFSRDGYALVITKAYYNQTKDSITINYGYIDKSNKFVVDTVNVLSLNINDANTIWKIRYLEEFVDKFENGGFEFLDSYFDSFLISENMWPYMDQATRKIGYKNIDGEIVIPAKYNYVSQFSENVAFVSNGISFDTNKSFSENLKVYSLINNKGEYIKQNEWSIITPFDSNGLTWCGELSVETDEEGNVHSSVVWSQIDKTGNITIGPINGQQGSYLYNGFKENSNLYIYQFPDIFGIHTGYSFINQDGQFATDWDGNNMITTWGESSEVFDDVTGFSEGYAGVKVFQDDESCWTFMDDKFQIATTEMYDSVQPFFEDLASVQQLNREFKHLGNWGAINKKFELVIPYKFSSIGRFYKGFAYAKINSSNYIREGYINRRGDFIWETKRQLKK